MLRAPEWNRNGNLRKKSRPLSFRQRESPEMWKEGFLFPLLVIPIEPIPKRKRRERTGWFNKDRVANRKKVIEAVRLLLSVHITYPSRIAPKKQTRWEPPISLPQCRYYSFPSSDRFHFSSKMEPQRGTRRTTITIYYKRGGGQMLDSCKSLLIERLLPIP